MERITAIVVLAALTASLKPTYANTVDRAKELDSGILQGISSSLESPERIIPRVDDSYHIHKPDYWKSYWEDSKLS